MNQANTPAARVAGLPSYFIVFVASMVAIGPFAIDTYLPAMPSMAKALGVDIVAVNATLSTYLLGFAAGQLLGGPISDQIGRRKVGLLGLLVFFFASLAIAAATNVTQVLLLRVVQAVGGGFATVICMAMVRDAYEPMEAAKRFPVVMLVMLSAPLFAPAIGSALLSLGWASIFVFLAIYSLVVAVAFLPVPETATQAPGHLTWGDILPQYWSVISRRVNGKLVPLRFIFTQGLLFSGTFVFITNSPFIYLEHYGIAEEWFVLYFGANILMMMLFTSITTRLIHRHSPHRLFRISRSIQLIAMLTLTIAVVSIEVPLWLFTALLAMVIGPSGMNNPTVSGLYLFHFDRLSGSATSLMNVTVFLFGSILGVVSGFLYDGTLKPIVYTMLAGLLAANVVALTIPPPVPNDD
ncbi:MAG: multidrug effflux MFS transporter [Pseudomonadales bacterium]